MSVGLITRVAVALVFTQAEAITRVDTTMTWGDDWDDEKTLEEPRA